MIKFDFSYAEVDTIYSSLVLFLEDLRDKCERSGHPEYLEESVAYSLYLEFRDVIEKFEN